MVFRVVLTNFAFGPPYCRLYPHKPQLTIVKPETIVGHQGFLTICYQTHLLFPLFKKQRNVHPTETVANQDAPSAYLI
jgi:hypothetical protein